MKRSVLNLAVSVTVVLVAGQANAYECLAEACPVYCELPVDYMVGELPDNLTAEDVLGEIAQAFATWGGASCTGLTSNYVGRCTTADGECTHLAGLTGSIYVRWLDPWPEELGSTATTVGLATPLWTTGPWCIEQASILLNAESYVWNVDANIAENNADVYTYVLSRLGSALGLRTTEGESVVNNPEAAYTALFSDDEDGICALYPGDGPGDDVGTSDAGSSDAGGSDAGSVDDAGSGSDGGSSDDDAGTGLDGGSTDNDGGSTDNDGGSTDNDGGSSDNDGGSTDNDGGSTNNDGGSNSGDGGAADTGSFNVGGGGGPADDDGCTQAGTRRVSLGWLALATLSLGLVWRRRRHA